MSSVLYPFEILPSALSGRERS